MTREESLAFRQNCPYDAMGDYSAFLDEDKQIQESIATELPQTNISVRQTK